MSAHKIGPFLGAVVILLVGITLGDWDRHQGLSGFTPLAFAQDAMGRDDDRGNDKKKDHFACYEVKCLQRGYNKGGDNTVECPEEYDVVKLFNQFTDEKRGLKIMVGSLKLLCVPTRKAHREHDHDDD